MDLSGMCDLGAPYFQNLFYSLETQRKENSLCDVVLCVEDGEFVAHRCVLAAASPYFKAMFAEHNFSESTSRKVRLHCITPRAMGIILDLFYTGKLKLDMQSAHEVMAAADLLMLPAVNFIASEYMIAILSSDQKAHEALKIRTSAKLYSIYHLEEMAESVVVNNFKDVINSEAFNELPFDEVVQLLQNDKISKPEIVIWRGAMKWIKHDFHRRQQYVSAIMQHIRFPLVESNALVTEIYDNPLMQSCDYCNEAIVEAMLFQVKPEDQCGEQLGIQHKPRLTSEQTVIYCLSGLEHFRCFLPDHNLWYPLRTPSEMTTVEVPPGCSNKVTLVPVEGLVYAAMFVSRPEEVGHLSLRALMVYSLSTNSWKKCSLPSQSSQNVSTVLIQTHQTLYACSRNCFEKYEQELDTWEMRSGFKIRPCHLIVSSSSELLLYNFEEGLLQEVRANREPKVTVKRDALRPDRFIAGVTNAVRLRDCNVLLSLRTVTGSYRKIFNTWTNLWQPANFLGHVPKELNWVKDPLGPNIVCDSSKDLLYFLGNKANLQATAEGGNDLQNVIPFHQYDMAERAWTRLPHLPKFMAESNLEVCICDGMYAVAKTCLL